MTSRESSFWQWVKAKIEKRHGHYVRVENSADTGTPDVEVCVDGFVFWLELKVADVTKKGIKVKISTDQAMFARARWRAGGFAFVMIKAGKSVYCISGNDDVLLKLSNGERVEHELLKSKTVSLEFFAVA